jgi:ribose-phosphate pyrophosphokinase
MRQDRSFLPGEAEAAKTLGAFLSQHFNWVVTVDPHLHRIRALSEIFNIPSRVVHAAPLVSDWILMHVHDPVLFGPDLESKQWVSQVAMQADAPFVVLQKNRRNAREVAVSVPELARWRDHTPVLVDDIISTGSTMRETLAHLAAQGMKPASCIGVHAIFAPGAYESLLSCRPVHIVTTNTVAHPTNAIDVTQLLANAIRELLI